MPEQGRRGQRVTLREVAALAGVSLKTASRVINDEAYVAPAKREAVHLAISQLNYRPDSNASSLRRTDRRTRAVGVIVEDIANPFSSGVLRTIEESVRQRRMITIAGSMVEDLERETELVSEISRRADALVLMSSALHHGYLETALGGNDIPIVFIDRPAIGYAADAVITNNAAGTIAAVQHLASHGHTRIAFIAGAANRYTTRERYAGYVKALGALELPVRDEYITLDRESPDAAEAAAIEQLQLPHPPTAIFAGHNLAAAGVIRALQRQRAEKRIALVGFDDFMFADLVRPGITVMAQDPGEIGRQAAEIVFARLAGDDSPFETRYVPSILTRRGSGEIPAPASTPAP